MPRNGTRPIGWRAGTLAATLALSGLPGARAAAAVDAPAAPAEPGDRFKAFVMDGYPRPVVVHLSVGVSPMHGPIGFIAEVQAPFVSVAGSMGWNSGLGVGFSVRGHMTWDGRGPFISGGVGTVGYTCSSVVALDGSGSESTCTRVTAGFLQGGYRLVLFKRLPHLTFTAAVGGFFPNPFDDHWTGRLAAELTAGLQF